MRHHTHKSGELDSDKDRLQVTDTRYQPPRVEKSRRLADVTGQGGVVPSGAPAPAPVPPPDG